MRRRSQGIEPENYVPAPEPPAPVENSGIGRESRGYVGPSSLYSQFTSGCTECGAMVYDIRLHNKFHEALDNLAFAVGVLGGLS